MTVKCEMDVTEQRDDTIHTHQKNEAVRGGRASDFCALVTRRVVLKSIAETESDFFVKIVDDTPPK